ncbi:response regulator [Cohnella sp. GbtcB17]|uniref:response regulator n=1 Tax=Cohnella sp. GbtcB17 TaxID=2824762 RepID=UPI001C2FDB78|nr:response regulator [Cohnella sp. GbtcB17]
MKYIVLDDEPIIRQGVIHKIRQTGLPLLFAGEADDGVSGLELIRSAKPDIVLTDIQMPEMNGLEFIRIAKTLYPRMEYIILSGFDDFEYAKKAIGYGVSHYLLKPVEDDELYEALSGLIERLQAEKHRDKMVLKLQQQAETGQEAARSQTLTRLLNEEETNIADPLLDELSVGCVSFSSVVLQVEPVKLPHYSFAEDEEELIWFSVKNIVAEGFKAGGIAGFLVHSSLNRCEFVYVFGLKAGQDRSIVLSAAETVAYGVRKYLKINAVVGIGPFADKLDRIQEIYRAAKQSARNAVLHGGNRVSHWTAQLPYKANRQSIIGIEDSKLLAEWLDRQDADQITRWTKRRLGAIAQDPNSVFVQIEWFCVDLYLLFNKYLLANAVDAEWTIGELDDMLRWLQQITRFGEIEERMVVLASTVIGRLARSGELSGKEVMEAVRAYIDHHFAEPLSLQSIGERFSIHPNYFSKRFKEKYGESFIEYLTSLRMKMAAKLLSDTDLKIHQIGERVGIEDAAYFGSVFRKCYGETPKQYRERLHST